MESTYFSNFANGAWEKHLYKIILKLAQWLAFGDAKGGYILF